MKYILKTTVNESGKKVFEKYDRGNEYIYLAKDENGNIGQVNKTWIMNSQLDIVNLGVSGNNIYPIDFNKKLRNQLEIVREIYQELFEDYSVSYGNDYLEFSGYTSDGTQVTKGVDISNLFDLRVLLNGLYEIGFNFDADYEAKEVMGMTEVTKDCEDIEDEDIEEDDDYRYLKWKYDEMRDYGLKLVAMTEGKTTELYRRGYDNGYAELLLKTYGNNELSDVIEMW